MNVTQGDKKNCCILLEINFLTEKQACRGVHENDKSWLIGHLLICAAVPTQVCQKVFHVLSKKKKCGRATENVEEHAMHRPTSF